MTAAEHERARDRPDGAPVHDDLIELGGQRSLRAYLTEVWERREFATVVPAADLRAQNLDTALGQLWRVLNPAAMIAVYYVVFGVILDTQRGVENFLGFLVIGVLLFQLSQRVALDAAGSLPKNEGLIRTIQFPRALLPISTVVLQTLSILPAYGVMIGLLVLTGERPDLRWLAFVVVAVGQTCFNLGVALVMARLGNAIRDLGQLLPHLFRLLFYVSGVLFSVDQFVTNDAMRSAFALNPLYSFITAARWSLLGETLPALVVVSVVAWTLVLPVIGLTYFVRRESEYGA